MKKTLNEYGDILSISDICKLLKIGKDSAYKLIHTNQIKHFYMGTHIKIPKIYVEEYINNLVDRSTNI